MFSFCAWLFFACSPFCQHTFEACTCNTRTALYLQCLWTEASLTSSDQVGVRLAHHWLRRLDANISRASFKMECCADMVHVWIALQEARTRSANQLLPPASVLIFVCGLAAQRFVSGVCVWSGQGEMSFFVYRLLINTSECPERNIVDSTFWNSGGELRRPLRDGHV